MDIGDFQLQVDSLRADVGPAGMLVSSKADFHGCIFAS